MTSMNHVSPPTHNAPSTPRAQGAGAPEQRGPDKRDDWMMLAFLGAIALGGLIVVIRLAGCD